MHELSIAVSLVEAASDVLSKLGETRVEAVRLKLGPLAGVVKDALLFSFDIAAAGTALEGVRLDIEDVPVTIWCTRCSAERVLSAVTSRRCPACDTLAAGIVRGDELQLVGLQVRDT